MHVFALVILTLVSLVAAPALAEDTVDLDQVEDVDTRSLDSADQGQTDSLDSVDRGRTHSLDSVSDGSTVSLDTADTDDSVILDDVPLETPASLDAADRSQTWEPPACSELELELASPATDDDQGWATLLFEAQQRIRSSTLRLQKADAAYSRALTSGTPRGEARAAIVTERDDARTALGEARCALPAQLERARRAGVEAAVLRPYL